jgi:hypothetical protein
LETLREKENNMTKHITKNEALNLLVRAVAEKGADHVDRNAHQYFRNGAPSCGVGLALSYVGVRPIHVAGWNGSNVPTMVQMKHHALPITFEDGAIKVLEKFRQVQDKNKPWGEALHAAAKV